jgi:hypothetical protein
MIRKVPEHSPKLDESQIDGASVVRWGSDEARWEPQDTGREGHNL